MCIFAKYCQKSARKNNPRQTLDGCSLASSSQMNTQGWCDIFVVIQNHFKI